MLLILFYMLTVRSICEFGGMFSEMHFNNLRVVFFWIVFYLVIRIGHLIHRPLLFHKLFAIKYIYEGLFVAFQSVGVGVSW
jgi:hypothetical protein